MTEESKPIDPAKEAEAVTGAEASAAAGKQPAVESEDDAEETADGPSTGSGATSGGSKKKSKRKKIKEALTGKPADPQASAQKALANLTPAQVTELMSLNPALAQELGIDPKTSLAGGSGSAGLSEASEALKRLNLQDIITGLTASGKNVKDMGAYKFWQTQLVPRFDEIKGSEAIKEGPLKIQKLEDIPKEPYPLVDGFEWDTLDLLDDAQLAEVFELLNGHYVEDDESMFRFNYSRSILKWAMMPPGWRKEWFRGVRASQSKKLVAFIAGTPLEFRVRENVIHGAEVNFICVHKKLRSKRLAPLLIKEITRLINLQGIYQALYTAGVVLPTPISTCRYYHRALNWQKLYEIGFSPLPSNSKPQYQVRKYALPDHTSTRGLREMQPKDLDASHELLKRYLKRYDLVGEFSREESEHWLLYRDPAPNGEQVLWSYVVEDENKKITDLISFYCVESSLINNPKHRLLRVAYLFYYATEVGLTSPVDKSALKTRLNGLVNDALILAKQAKFDVFNALSIMDNALFIEDQKFGPGDGQLHYYLFNYRANPIAGGVNKKNQIDSDHLSGVGFAML